METFTQIVKTVLIVDAVAVAVGGGIAVTKEITNKVKNKMNEKKLLQSRDHWASLK